MIKTSTKDIDGINISTQDINEITLLIKQISEIFESKGCPLNSKKDVDVVMWTKDCPMITSDRKTIYICPDSKNYKYPQIAYQLAHEITHFHNSYKQALPQKIKWIDELLCSNAAIFILNELPKKCSNADDEKLMIDYFPLCAPMPTPLSIEELKDYLKAVIPIFEGEEWLIYKEPYRLNRMLYYNQEHFDFWKLLRVFKTVAINLIAKSNADLNDFYVELQLLYENNTDYEKEFMLFKTILDK